MGRVIENSLTGERLTFLAPAEETGGELLKVKSELPAGSPGAPMHYHLAFTERFEVLNGRLDMWVGSKKNHIILTAGQSAAPAFQVDVLRPYPRSILACATGRTN